MDILAEYEKGFPLAPPFHWDNISRFYINISSQVEVTSLVSWICTGN
jgi:hypothetical protein